MISGHRYVDATGERLVEILRGSPPTSIDWVGASGELQRRSIEKFAKAADQTEKYTLVLVRLTWTLAVPTVLVAILTVYLAVVAYRTQPQPQDNAPNDNKARPAAQQNLKQSHLEMPNKALERTRDPILRY